MTLVELIEALEEMAEQYGEDTPVRFASQPSWPFEYDITAVQVTEPDDNEEWVVEDAGPVIYLVEGSQLGYLPPWAKQQIGW